MIRDSTGLMFAIAAAILDGKHRRTHIMYAASLTHSQLTLYLGQLEAKGLVSVAPDPDDAKSLGLYNLTEKGQQWFDAQRRAYDLLGEPLAA